MRAMNACPCCYQDIGPEVKYCPGCQTFKAPHYFGANRARKDGKTSYCRPCTQAMQRKHHTAPQTNREK